MSRPASRRAVLTPLSVALLAAALAAGVFAEGEAESAAARWTRVAAAFPAPSAAKGFDWQLDFLVQGSRMGAARVTAAPDGEGWKVSLSAELPGGLKQEETERLRKDLSSLGGVADEVDPKEGAKHSEWTRGADGAYDVKIRRGEAEPAAYRLEGKTRVMSSLGTALLACRMLPADPGAHEVEILESGAADEAGLLLPGRIDVEGVKDWTFGGQTRKAWMVRLTRKAQVFLAAFDPETRDFLGLTFEGAPVALAPKGSGKEAPQVDLSKPAKDGKVAAVQAAIGFACADRDLLDRALHWPTLVADAQAQPGGETLTEETLKAMVYAQLAKQVERAMIEPMLLSMMEGLETETLEGGHLVVKFPEMMKNLRFETAEIDGAWYVVKFPSQG